jgi:hypothetical protein
VTVSPPPLRAQRGIAGAAHRYLPSMQPHTQTPPAARLDPALDPGVTDAPLQVQCPQHRALGVILLGHGHAKHHDHPTADQRLEDFPIRLYGISGQGIQVAQLAVAYIRLIEAKLCRSLGQGAT